MKTKSKFITAGAALGFMLLGTAPFLSGDDNSDRNSQFDFALVGDVPYAPTAVINQASTVVPPPTAKVQIYPSPEYNALISDINAHTKVQFTVHMGDIKAGDTWCAGGGAPRDAAVPTAANIYTNNRTLFNTFRNALIYLPGDNEWTDCHRTNNGAYTPTERLSYLRTIFYPSNQSLGQRPIALNRQPLYPENVTWRIGDILFVGINQPGSNNNSQRNIAASNPAPTDDNELEFTQRNNANIAWLNAAFATATSQQSVRAIVIMQQANVFERFLEPNQGYIRSGYEAFVKALRNGTVAWGKPVVLVGGDTHTVRIDKPLTTTAVRDSSGNYAGFPGHTTSVTGTTPVPTVASTTLFSTIDGSICTLASATCAAPVRVQNFTRVEVFGSPDVAWIRAIVDPFDPNVFSFSAQTIAGTGRGRDGRDNDDDLN